MRQIGIRVYSIWCMFWFACFLIVVFPYLRYNIHTGRIKRVNQIRRVWAKFLFFICGYPYQINGKENLTEKQVIYCSNHSSILDIPMFAIIANDDYRFLVKSELLKVPLLNIFFKYVDISIERGDKMKSARSYMHSKTALEGGSSLIIFPEGKRTTHPPELLPFKDGAFSLAIEHQIPLVPVTFLNSWKHFYKNDEIEYATPGLIKAVVHPAIETKGLTKEDIPQLKEKVYNIISFALDAEVCETKASENYNE